MSVKPWARFEEPAPSRAVPFDGMDVTRVPREVSSRLREELEEHSALAFSSGHDSNAEEAPRRSGGE